MGKALFERPALRLEVEGHASPTRDLEALRRLELQRMVKDIPVGEMERLMLATIVVTQDDLRLLARQRAQVVREQILRSRKIETERVFLVEPKSIPPEHKDKVSDNRVDFRLQ